MRWLLVLLVPLPILLLVALALLLAPLPLPLPMVGSASRNLLAAIVTGLLGLAYVAGVAYVTVRGVVARARSLDAVMTDRGLYPTSPGITGRSYSGEVDGWPVRVDYVQAHRFTPALLNLRVSAPVPVELALATRGPLLACAKCPRLALAIPGLPETGVYSRDEAIVSSLLWTEDAAAALRALLSDQRTAGMRQLYLDDDGVWLRAHPSRSVSSQTIAAWLDQMVALANCLAPTARSSATLQPPPA